MLFVTGASDISVGKSKNPADMARLFVNHAAEDFREATRQLRTRRDAMGPQCLMAPAPPSPGGNFREWRWPGAWRRWPRSSGLKYVKLRRIQQAC